MGEQQGKFLQFSGHAEFTRGHCGWFVFSFIFGVISVTSSHAGRISKIPRGDSMAILQKNPAPPWDNIDVWLQSSQQQQTFNCGSFHMRAAHQVVRLRSAVHNSSPAMPGALAPAALGSPSKATLSGIVFDAAADIKFLQMVQINKKKTCKNKCCAETTPLNRLLSS